MPKKAPERMPKMGLLLIPALIAILYGWVVGAPFAYDDRIHIVENQQVISFRNAVDFSAMRMLLDHPFGLAGRPLLFLTYGLNYGVSGLNSAAFRLMNFLIHAANSVLVFLIVLELGGLAPPHKKEGFWLGMLAGALFAAHPLLTESVTYIAGRSSSLCGAFYFGGAYAVLRAGRSSYRAKIALLLLAAACTVLGWLVKQDILTLPAASVAILWLAWPKTISSRWRWAATAVFISLLGSLLILQNRSLARVAAASQGNEALVAAGFEQTIPFLPYVFTSVKEYTAYYFWRLFLPVSLSVDPDAGIITSPLSIGFLGSLLLLSGLAIAAFWIRERNAMIATGIALILISPLSAYCLFPLADVVAEHRAYISVLGAVILLAGVISSTPRPVLISIGVVAVYGWLTIERNRIWNDEILLWQDAEQKAPRKLRPHLNLGALYQSRGETDRAIGEYKLVLDLSPDHQAALSNLASLYLARNDLARTEELLGRAIARHSQFAAVYLNLAVVRLRQGRFGDARTLLEHAQTLNPSQLMIHHNLGDILFNENRPDKAIEEYGRELQLNPNSTITHLNLAKVYEATGSRERAIEHYRIVERAYPGSPEVEAALQRLK